MRIDNLPQLKDSTSPYSQWLNKIIKIWNDTDSGFDAWTNLSATSATIGTLTATTATIGSTTGPYLPLAGGTMSGAIAMGSNKVTGLTNGSAAQDAAAFGQIHVLQVVSATDSTASSTASASFQSTSTTVSITPTSGSSKVLIIASGLFTNNTAASSCFASIFRGGTNLGGTNGLISIYSPTAIVVGSGAMSILDSPATTLSTAYTVKILLQSGAGPAQWGGTGIINTIVAMEVQ